MKMRRALTFETNGELTTANSTRWSGIRRMMSAISRLRARLGLQVPLGYEDELGFHFGTPPAPVQAAPPAIGSSYQ